MSEPENDDIPIVYNVELSPRELAHIGLIVSQWASLEYEIFTQTLMTFVDSEITGNELPRSMNNLQFSSVLDLWEERVINKANGEVKEVLIKELEHIRHYHEFRNAIAHGMWEWDKSDPKKIRSVRIRNRNVITIRFTAANLESFSTEVGKINFKIRCPSGLEDLAKIRAEQRFYMSRIGAALFSGDDELLPDEWKSPLPSSAKGKSE
jgi:hypothetical protein